MGVTEEDLRWVKKVLGMVPASAQAPRLDASPRAGVTQPRRRPPPPPPARAIGAGLSGGVRRGFVPASVKPLPRPPFQGDDGRRLQVTRRSDDTFVFSAPPPPMREITFAGGGGKGVALPGVVKAMQESGALDDVRQFRGASVGSITAAVLAAGMTPEDFEELTNEENMKQIVQAGDKVPLNLDGDLLENFVRTKMERSIEKLMVKAEAAAGGDRGDRSGPPFAAFDRIRAKFGGIPSVTFEDLRTLHRILPGIKELAVAATKMGDTPEQLMFDADRTPDAEVARAVHASAAFPLVFKPVEMPVNDTEMRLNDGGIMNNVPTSDQTEGKRALAPMPAEGSLAVMFEGDDAEAVTGPAEPTATRHRIKDWGAKAPNAVQSYLLTTALRQGPSDIIVAPMVVQKKRERKFRKGEKVKEKDYRGATTKFAISRDGKQAMQAASLQEARKRLTERDQPMHTVFESEAQMLNCVSEKDLETMANGGYDEAGEVLEFRRSVARDVEQLASFAKSNSREDAVERMIETLSRFDQLAGGDEDRLGFIGRELNESGELDDLIKQARIATTEGGTSYSALDAAVAVNTVVQVREQVKKIRAEVLVPKMVAMDTHYRERMATRGHDVEWKYLHDVDRELLRALTPQEVDKILKGAAKYFDKPGRHRKKTPRDPGFAGDLRKMMMLT